jgi:hypothetical protein
MWSFRKLDRCISIEALFAAERTRRPRFGRANLGDWDGGRVEHLRSVGVRLPLENTRSLLTQPDRPFCRQPVGECGINGDVHRSAALLRELLDPLD